MELCLRYCCGMDSRRDINWDQQYDVIECDRNFNGNPMLMIVIVYNNIIGINNS